MSTARAQPRPAAEQGDLLALVTRPDFVVRASLLLLATCGLFYSWLYRQGRFSVGEMQDWGHAFIVPAISLYLLWQHREWIARTPVRTYWPGLVAMAFGIITYAFVGLTRFTGIHMIQGVSIAITIFGICLLLLGPAMMRYLFLPISYLVLATTISEQVMNRITWPLQLLASDASYVVISILGIDASLMGNTITVFTSEGEPRPLNVAEACSGMRMLIAFLALGVAVALVATSQWWQRVVLVVLSVPLALGLNVARVVVLGVASLYNPDLASGEAHGLIGMILLVPGFLIYMGLVWVLGKTMIESNEPEPKGAA